MDIPLYNLSHTFNVGDQGDFERIIAKLDSSELIPITQRIGAQFNSAAMDERVFGPMQTRNSSYSSSNKVLAQVYISKNGILIVELERTQNHPGLLALTFGDLGKQPSKLRATAICNKYELCDELLCQAADVWSEVAGGMFPVKHEVGTRKFVKAAQVEFDGRLKALKHNLIYDLPKYDESEAELSLILIDKKFRDFAVKFAQLSSMSNEQLKEASKLIALDSPLKNFLIQNGLAEKEKTIVCRKDNRKIATINLDRDGQSNLNIRCATCGRPFHKELISEGLSISDKFRVSLTKSRWMNVFVTEKLIKLGFPLELIAWNVKFGADEVDVIANLNGLIWLFELKDTEFSYSDAQAFNHRRTLISPWASVVLTTQFVSPDAKELFDAAEKRGDTLLGGGGGMKPPLYVEGIDNFDDIVSKEVRISSSVQARWLTKSALQSLDDFVSKLLLEELIS